MFGMGTGVTSLLSSPNLIEVFLRFLLLVFLQLIEEISLTVLLLYISFLSVSFLLNLLFFGQALDLLVSVSYMCYHTSTSDLSTT